MTKRMLVDASHQEETRVVILDGNKVEEFDYESAARRPLKGNIYLAKVTRVEPSLQACFVEYGGNRHGFLAFSEIHPDYYQIPTADRQALLEESRSSEPHQDDEEDEASDVAELGVPDPVTAADRLAEVAEGAAGDGSVTGEIVEVVTEEGDDVWIHDPETGADDAGDKSASHDTSSHSSPETAHPASASNDATARSRDDDGAQDDDVAEGKAGEEDAEEEVPRRQHRSYRRYKIQEVIKRRQVLLIQVVKEERGNKGAALTTYLSLAGRYCVLMPNTDRGGGISRKISNVADRRKLKEMAGELEVPEGMGVIIRTAGANRTKQEIRRDFEYLLRQWDSVRDLTLRSSAPTLVYEEGNLIKRTIRDLFSKEIDEVLVEGDLGFKEAHGFMSMLMPSHADSVKNYKDSIPLYQRYGVEAALDGMFNPIVRLRSGGYIVINQTEALVAIDVNSGKSTREHHIEDTALKTNLEAAEEVARQLRLRDLAGLVVIDFIDMEEHRNNRSVEKRLKDSLRHDRARIQLGRISPFGLLEMSRQRLRAGMVEGATSPCPHCEGRGVIRSVGSMALRVLRAIEEYCQHEKLQAVTLRVPPEVAIYILNHKRPQLSSIEERNNVYVFIDSRASLAASAYEIERGAPVAYEPRKPSSAKAVTVESEMDANEPDAEDLLEADDVEVETAGEEDGASTSTPGGAASGEGPDGRRKRRRRRRGRDRGPRPETGPETSPAAFGDAPALAADDVDVREAGDEDGDDEGPDDQEQAAGGAPLAEGAEGPDGQRRRRRRGRRGRRGRRFGENGNGAAADEPANGIGNLPTPAEALDAPDWPAPGGFARTPGITPDQAAPRRPSEPYSSVRTTDAPIPDEIQARSQEPRAERSSIATFFGFGSKPEKTDVQSRPDVPVRPEPSVRAEPPARSESPTPAPAIEPEAANAPKKRGWWQKQTDA
jgi:ribonuclease E